MFGDEKAPRPSHVTQPWKCSAELAAVTGAAIGYSGGRQQVGVTAQFT